MLPPPVYPVTDTALARTSTHAELVERLARAGATWIQIREKKLSDEALQAQLVLIRGRLRPETCLIINDRVALARQSGIAGVHLGQTDVPVVNTRAILPHAIIGISTHSLEQARAAETLPVDYISIGPVFPTATKTENAPVGLEVVDQVRRSVSRPLVAIGGISLDTAASLWAMGIESVAVVSDIMTSVNMERRVEQYLKLWSSLHA